MPQSSYRTYVGYALDTINGQLSAGVDSGATSLPLVNTNGTTGTLTTSGSSYSAIILDGPGTETVACTGDLTDGAIACDALANAHSEWAYVVFQLTASIGPTAFLYADTFQPSDNFEQLFDTAHIGSLVEQIGAVQGMREATFEFGGPVRSIAFGYLLGGIFGAEDYSAASPVYTHAFSVNNQGNGQPPRGLLYIYDAYNTRVFSGRFSELTLSADPKQLLKYTAKFMGRASGVVANMSNPPIPPAPMQSWLGKATIGGSDVGKTLTFETTWQRQEAENILTINGTQDPWDVFVGALVQTTKFSLVFDDDTQQNNYFNESQPTVDFKWSRNAGAEQLEIHMEALDYTKADVKPIGKAYVTNDIEATALANTTDATTSGGGATPCKVTLVNAQSGDTTYV